MYSRRDPAWEEGRGEVDRRRARAERGDREKSPQVKGNLQKLKCDTAWGEGEGQGDKWPAVKKRFHRLGEAEGGEVASRGQSCLQSGAGVKGQGGMLRASVSKHCRPPRVVHRHLEVGSTSPFVH